MEIPKYIQDKMRRLARISADSTKLSHEIDYWFESHGFDIEKLRSGDGYSLEELEYGNDITDAFVESMKCGQYED